MWERIWRAGRAAWALLGLGALIVALLYLGYVVRVVIPPLVLAGAIVFILNPVVTMLQRRGVPRAAGTGLSYLGVVGLLVAVGFLVAPLIRNQTDELSAQWPQLRADMEDWLNDISARSKEDEWVVEVPNVEEIREQLDRSSSDSFTEEFDRVVADAAAQLEAADSDVLAADLDRVAASARGRFPRDDGLTEQIARVREVGTRIFEIGLIFILGPIIAFYLLVDLPQIRRVVTGLIPERAKPQVLHLGSRLNLAIGGYFRGQLGVAFIVGTMVSIGLAILDLPFWLLVGMVAGVFNLIPLIGPWVGAVPGVLIALTTRDVGTALWVMAIMAGAQQIDNHFISPLVMQRTTSLHPSVVMLALLAGGTLGGFFGLLMVVPVTAALKVVLSHLWHIYILGDPFPAGIPLAEAADAGDADEVLPEPGHEPQDSSVSSI